MKIVTRQEAGEIRISESLLVTILEICCSNIKLGFATKPSRAAEKDLAHELSLNRSSRRGYYRFSENGGRLLVLELAKGQHVALNGSEELVVLEVRPAGTTLAICSDHECKQFRDDHSVAGRTHAIAWRRSR